MKNLMGILFLFLTTLCSSQCVNDWPEFSDTDMSRFNACESVLGTGNVGQLRLLWSFLPSQELVRTSPAVANGVVYFGTHEGNFYAVNSTTGAEIWERHIGAPFASSPAVGPNLVYFDSGPSLFALHRAAGAVAWKLKTGVSCSSPVVAGDVVYAAAGCTDGGTIFAVTAKKGKKLWSYTPAGGVAQFVASPVVADGIVYDTDMGNNSYAVDARTGNLLWEFSPGGYGGSFGACRRKRSRIPQQRCRHLCRGREIRAAALGAWKRRRSVFACGCERHPLRRLKPGRGRNLRAEHRQRKRALEFQHQWQRRFPGSRERRRL